MELVCKLSVAEWKGVDMLEECIDQDHESTLSKGDGHARGGVKWVVGGIITDLVQSSASYWSHKYH